MCLLLDKFCKLLCVIIIVCFVINVLVNNEFYDLVYGNDLV